MMELTQGVPPVLSAHREMLLKNVVSLYERFRLGSVLLDDFIEAPEAGKSHRSWMAHAFATKANHQPDADVFRHFDRQDGTILDVGAHWGYTALAMRLTGTDCPIVSIEASVMHVDCLDELRKHDGGYDFLIQALGAAIEDRVFYTPVVNGVHITGLSNVDGAVFNTHHAEHIAGLVDQYVPIADSYKVQLLKQPISLRPLDDVLRTNRFRVPVEVIAAIKLDVEHHESAVISGAMKTILRHRPFMMIEGGNRGSVGTVMRDLGYLYGDRTNDQIRLHDEPSMQVNGYWVHPSRLRQYRDAGLILS